MIDFKKSSLLLAMFAFVGLSVFTSCEDEDIDQIDTTLTYDCDSVEGNFGDVCAILLADSNGGTETVYGLLSQNCQCVIEQDSTLAYDCPVLMADYGAACQDSSGMQGVIDTNCECEIATVGYDCPQWEGNVGDSCVIFGETGIITADCDCQVTTSEWDCPDLFADFGSLCQDSTGVQGVVNMDCECELEGNELDCPGLGGNIGDPCQGGWGTITADCDCEENTSEYDCPELQLDFNFDCFTTDSIPGYVNMDCECTPW